MKITITFLFFSLMISSIFGQGYRPMLTEGSTWHEYFTIWPPGNATLHIGGDTIINNITYKKYLQTQLTELY